MTESVESKVWVARGKVTRNSILQRALVQVRDEIPVVYEMSSDITHDEPKEQDGQPGREYTVTITYTPRATTSLNAEPVDVNHVVESLAPPKFETFLGDAHPEDAA
jgi:hypothetical protein